VQEGRFAQVDTLRAVAVLAVTASHTVDLNGPVDRYGAYGVPMFFVISGFLITGLLMDARQRAISADVGTKHALRSFYARRALRVVPLYYLVLGVASVIGVANIRSEFFWHVTFLSNWYFVQHGAWTVATSHLWSLSVEEQFYLFWALVVLFLPRRALPWAIGTLLMTGPITRLILAHHHFWTGEMDIFTPAALDALGWGCLLAYAWRACADRPERLERVIRWVPVAVVALFTIERVAELLHHLTPTVLALTGVWWPLLCMWLLHKTSRGVAGRFGKVLSWRPLVYVGIISYGIYLLHLFVMPMFEIVQRRLFDLPIPTDRGVAQFVFVGSISIGAAALSWIVVESPINRLKNRFPYAPPNSASSLQESNANT
jgi:peptidoglycan/LPS O-acetylase OafA/YrhL